MPQTIDSLPPDTTALMDPLSDPVFEVNPVTRFRLNTAPSS